MKKKSKSMEGRGFNSQMKVLKSHLSFDHRFYNEQFRSLQSTLLIQYLPDHI